MTMTLLAVVGVDVGPTSPTEAVIVIMTITLLVVEAVAVLVPLKQSLES